MNEIKLNETPIRTSRNFNINNIKLKDLEIPSNVGKFNAVTINSDCTKILVDNNTSDFSLKYGVSAKLTKQIKNNANQKIRVTIDSKMNKEIVIEFKFDKTNKTLVDNIEIVANENSKATVIVKYDFEEIEEYYHNGIIRLIAKKNSNINVIITNFMNSISDNFLSIQNTLEDGAKAKYIIVDFGGKNSITNYYSSIDGEEAENILNTVYLGKENQVFDLNYIAELKGKKSNIDIDVQGALKDFAKKHFKGTIDFKKGCKKAKGNENEFCMLLSDTAKSLALPMLLCSEEDVEGNHSSSAGKIGEKELFYIMSRGFEKKEAMKLMVRARFNNIIEKIKNEDLKNEILEEIDKRLD